MTKINIHQLVKNDGWATHLNGHIVSLRPEQNLLKVYVDGIVQHTLWEIQSIPIRGDISYRGGRIPWDRSETHYVVSNGKRFRHLYLDPEKYAIGTRHYHNAGYAVQFLTGSKWRAQRQAKVRWLEARYQRREKNRLKKMRARSSRR